MVLAGTGDSITYRDLDRRSVRLVRALRDGGLGADSGVAVICENRLEWSEIVWATQRAGSSPYRSAHACSPETCPRCSPIPVSMR
jgi:fatty-acyl-CoA synthase